MGSVFVLKQAQKQAIWDTASNTTGGTSGTRRVHVLELGHAPRPVSSTELSDAGTCPSAPEGR